MSSGSIVQSSVSPPKILIVEDNIAFSKSLCASLNDLTTELKVVDNGKTALDLIKQFNPSILLLDLNMPGLNGLEILLQIKEMKINVIIISGEIKLLNQIPMNSYDIISCVLVKPVDINVIYNNVSYLLLEQKNKKTITKIKTLLNEFEFNKSSNGYIYLLECLIEIFNNPKVLNNIEQSIYTVVASKHGLDSINRVKWCIIKSLKSMYRYTDKNTLLKYHIDTTKITPKNFMTEIYNIIQKGDC